MSTDIILRTTGRTQAQPDARPVSLTLPIREAPYLSRVLFPFFDGLIPEGWLLDIAEKTGNLTPETVWGSYWSVAKIVSVQ
jgi:HipA-like protein